MVFYAFDLLHLDGFDTRPAPLIGRKRALQGFLAEARASATRVLYSDHFEDGVALYAQAAKLGLEGVVSKRADAPYRSGRGDHWHKTKCWQVGRFIVVGFAPDGMGGLAKLRLARREGDKLVYAGRVGTGWDYRTARDIRNALAPLVRPTCPLAKPLRKKDTTWTEPRGGFYIWLTAPDGVDTVALTAAARARKVAYVPGRPFYAGDAGTAQIRLAYSRVADHLIDEGVRRIGEVLRTALEET